MWNSWAEKAKTLAEKAAKAAAELDHQINESVGVVAAGAAAGVAKNTSAAAFAAAATASVAELSSGTTAATTTASTSNSSTNFWGERESGDNNNLQEDDALNDPWADDFDVDEQQPAAAGSMTSASFGSGAILDEREDEVIGSATVLSPDQQKFDVSSGVPIHASPATNQDENNDDDDENRSNQSGWDDDNFQDVDLLAQDDVKAASTEDGHPNDGHLQHPQTIVSSVAPTAPAIEQGTRASLPTLLLQQESPLSSSSHHGNVSNSDDAAAATAIDTQPRPVEIDSQSAIVAKKIVNDGSSVVDDDAPNDPDNSDDGRPIDEAIFMPPDLSSSLLEHGVQDDDAATKIVLVEPPPPPESPQQQQPSEKGEVDPALSSGLVPAVAVDAQQGNRDADNSLDISVRNDMDSSEHGVGDEIQLQQQHEQPALASRHQLEDAFNDSERNAFDRNAEVNHMEAPPIESDSMPASSFEYANTSIQQSRHDDQQQHQYQQELASKEDLIQALTRQLEQLHAHIQQREDQLISKTEQWSILEQVHDAERLEWRQKLQETKEEAKRRIQMAKERVDASEEQLKQVLARHNSTAESASHQAEIIAALREEGQKLALKQSEMEKAVRTSKAETRDLREQLEIERQTKNHALERIEKLDMDLKMTKEDLALARRGESQADRFEQELRQMREESQRKAGTIITLEQKVKELKMENKELLAELEASKKGATIESEREQKRLRKEHEEAVAELEGKIQSLEREAAAREDALRLEVSEIRKRWQDAVRRADTLSMDVQSNTAPLLRQLESLERQHRSRTAAWAELESSLRSELEENVIANEKLSKERTEWKTKFSRMERTSKESEVELKAVKEELEEKTIKLEKVEGDLKALESEYAKMKQEWAEVERLANEGVSRVRSEMTKTVVDSEERYRSQIESIEVELRKERDTRKQLEKQVSDLLEKMGGIRNFPPSMALPTMVSVDSKPQKKLRRSQGQEEILADALNGLDDTTEGDETMSEEWDWNEPISNQQRPPPSSFAAVEELSSRLKVAKVELESLRKSLADSERTREKMLEEISLARNAMEKLPLFEARVRELTAVNQEQALEIQGLQEDLADVKELYRSQLSSLMEEKVLLLNGSVQEGNDANV